MSTIALANLKGGCGKSTTALHLAHGIARAQCKVLLVDADPQGSASDWGASRDDKPPFQIVAMKGNIHRDLPDLASQYDHTVIDTPPRTDAVVRSAVLAADLVLCPLSPSSFDLWGLQQSLELIEQARGFKPDLGAALVLAKAVVGTSITSEITEVIKEFEFPLLATVIHQRIAFAESASGQTVFEAQPKGKAAQEMKAFVSEVRKQLGLSRW